MERDSFASLVTEMAGKDLENFGIALLSFTIKEISDKVEYLTSMGRKEIAKTKHKAAVDVAMVEKDFKIKQSDSELAVKEVELRNSKEIEEQNKVLQTESSKQNCEANKKQTEAKMAYNLESAKIKQLIEKERKNVQLEEANLTLAYTKNKLKRTESNYHRELVLEAEAEAYRIKQETEANRYKKLAIANATSYRTRKLADAVSEFVSSNGKVQVELLKKRAAAFKLYGDAAVLQLTLATLPKLAAEIAAPLKNINEIVLVNGPTNQPSLSSNFTADAIGIASALPPSIKALTGLDFCLFACYIMYKF